MSEEKKYMMLACMNIQDELEAALREYGKDYPVFYLPAWTHDNPERMHKVMQRLIDSLTDIDYLLMPMGRCGNSTIGLNSGRVSLVLPKCDDCVNLALSQDSLKDVDRPEGCLFFTRSWLRYEHSGPNEYNAAIAKYGKDMADTLMQSIYGAYQNFAILDTGYYDKKEARASLEPLAEVIPVGFKELKAPYGVLRKMVNLELDDNFVIVPPGKTVTKEILS